MASATMHANGLMSPPATEKASSQGSPARVVLAGKTGRILCVADIRGDFHELNRLIREHEATAVIHTGDFGFINADSLERMGDKILRHLLQYSPLLAPSTRQQLLSIPPSAGRAALIAALNNSSLHFPLSQFPHLLSGAITFPVPVFTVWGLIEDVRVIEKFRTGEYEVSNLSVIDEASSRVLDVGGVRLRLFGLGGAVASHKMFDNGEGHATIAGAQGTMWTTALQIGELVDTAQRVHDSTETRLFISSAPISRNGLLSQLSSALKADLTISGGLHFRYPASFNEFSVHGDFEAYRLKLSQARESFVGVYQSVKDKVDSSLNENQLVLLKKALTVASNVPESDDGTWTNTWHWVLSDASCGHMLFSISDGRVSAETKSSGLNFSHRAQNIPAPPSGAVPQQSQTQATPVPRSSQPQPESSIKPPPTSTPAPGTTAPIVRPAQAQPAVRPPVGGFRPPPGPNAFGPMPRHAQQGQNVRPINPSSGPRNLPTKPAVESATTAPTPPVAPASTATAVRPPVQPPRGPKNAFAPTGISPTAPKAAENKRANNVTPKPTPTPAPAATTETAKESETSAPAAAAAAAAANSEDKSTVAVNGGQEKKARPEPKTEKSDEGAAATTAATATQTPRPKKHELFVRGFDTPVEEATLKGLFPGHEENILNVKIPMSMGPMKKQQNYAYVEFTSEETLKAALENNTGKIGEKQINIVLSNPPRGAYVNSGRGRGQFAGGRGRGGMRGGGRGGRGGAAAGASGGGEGSTPAAAASATPAPAKTGGEGSKD